MYESKDLMLDIGLISILSWLFFSALDIFKGNKISKRPSILISSSSRCQKWQQKNILNSNLLHKSKQGVIFCCRFWHQMEDESKIGGLFQILLPLKDSKISEHSCKS